MRAALQPTSRASRALRSPSPQPPPPPGHLRIVVRHLNDIPNDNRVLNLAYGTDLDNAEDRKRNEAIREDVLTNAVAVTFDGYNPAVEGDESVSSQTRRTALNERVDRPALSATTPMTIPVQVSVPTP